MSPPALIAAVDLGPQTARVLHHAAGFARLLDLSLKILHVSPDTSVAARERVLNTCLQEGPYQTDFHLDDIVVRSGQVSEMIAREAQRDRAALVVMGARGLSSVASLILGSTSEAVLRSATVPVLLVPASDMDIVSMSNGMVLNCGTVIAALDLSEQCDRQLAMASRLAHVGSQPLILMTVAKGRLTDHQAGVMLRQRAHGLEPKRPTSMIVRRGTVATEIVRCAGAEGAGLVVMGLRASPKSQPGSIASAVLKTKRAFVLAVPAC